MVRPADAALPGRHITEAMIYQTVHAFGSLFFW